MEALFVTRTRAPLLIGGLPDPATGRVCCALEVPGLLSYLAHGSFEAEVMGLDQVPPGRVAQPAAGPSSPFSSWSQASGMVLVGLCSAWVRWRRPEQLSTGPGGSSGCW